MAEFLIILGIPTLGLLLYGLEHLGRHAESPGLRKFARWGLLPLGLISGLGALLLFAYGTLPLFDRPQQKPIWETFLWMLSSLIGGGLLLWTARNALRVFRLPAWSAESTRHFDQEQACEGLRFSAACLALVPMLMFAWVAVFIFFPLILFGFGFWAARNARQSQFLWTLALAVKEQFPLADEVDAFAMSQPPRVKKRLAVLAGRLRDGYGLGESLELTTGLIPTPVATEIRLAESTGNLPTALPEIAARTTHQMATSREGNSLALTIFYVWALTIVLFLVAGFVFIFIVPKFKNIFESFGIELPEMTVSLVRLSDLVVENTLPVLCAAGLLEVVVLGGMLMYFIGWGNLNLPLLMRWFPRWDAPPLLRGLSRVISSGQSLPDVVREMSRRHLRADMRNRLSRIEDGLSAGQPFWMPLRAEGFINTAEADALAAAQRVNNLPWVMRTIADSMDRTGRHRLLSVIEYVKPIAVIGVGIMVGYFVIGMFMPIVRLVEELI